MWKTIVAPTVLVSLLWITISGATTYYIHWVSKSHARLLDENLSTIRAAGAMQDISCRLLVLATETAWKESDEPDVEFRELQAAFRRHLSDARRTSFSQGEQDLIASIEERFLVFCGHVNRLVQSRAASGSPAVPSGEKEKASRLARAITERCRQLLELDDRLLMQSTAQNSEVGVSFNLIRLGFLIVGPILGVLLGLRVARGLHQSISQISINLQDATGELGQEVGRVEVHTSDSLPALRQQVEAVSVAIRQVVEQLQATRSQAIRAERLAAVGELAAGVAHELRNPLTSVKLLFQMSAQESPDGALGSAQLEVVQNEIARMERTIQGLLDFARPPQLTRVQHDLRTTIRRALNLVEGRARHQNVTIAEEIPPTTILVDGDPEQLDQVFVNLLLNGIEAMPCGGTLHVALDADPEAPGMCRVTFRDSGSGIPPPVLDRMFEPFVTGKEHGTGLGLAVSHRIIVEHGGTLHAANLKPSGAMFTVLLPLVAGAGPMPSPAEDEASADGQTVGVADACEASETAESRSGGLTSAEYGPKAGRASSIR